MKPFKCLIVDDEPVAQRILEGYLADFSEFELVDKCLHALAARTVLQQTTIDLMFLDLEMPKLKGLAFLKRESLRQVLSMTPFWGLKVSFCEKTTSLRISFVIISLQIYN